MKNVAASISHGGPLSGALLSANLGAFDSTHFRAYQPAYLRAFFNTEFRSLFDAHAVAILVTINRADSSAVARTFDSSNFIADVGAERHAYAGADDADICDGYGF